MDAHQVRRAISVVDLTDLTEDCTAPDVERLCDRAARHHTAAVCVWPDFVALATDRLASTPVRVATVVNFPTGDERPFSVRGATERALTDGADDVDVVLPYRSFLAGDRRRSIALLDVVRSVTADRAIMKVILETGELDDPTAIEAAARFAVDHGADFIKTSTGKSPVSATPEAAEIMLGVIADTKRPVGIKPSGGIRTADDAGRYLELADRVMGGDWVGPATFRFGASGLLDALLRELGVVGDDDGGVDGDGSSARSY